MVVLMIAVLPIYWRIKHEMNFVFKQQSVLLFCCVIWAAQAPFFHCSFDTFSCKNEASLKGGLVAASVTKWQLDSAQAAIPKLFNSTVLVQQQ